MFKIVGIFALSYAMLAFLWACSPLPLFGRSRVYGRKSIVDQTVEEMRISRLERERDHLRFCVLMLGLPLIAATVLLFLR